jgi:ABC-2 type transport system permease protein
MISALLYLRLASLKNLLQRRALRLRQPQYLAAAFVAIAYFYFFFFRQIGRAFSGGPHDAIPTAMVLFSALLLALMLLARPVATWLGSANRAGLAFNEAEIAFLFPAPISRRTLIHYYLANQQLSTLLSALFFSVLSSHWAFLGGNFLTRVIGWWVIFATLGLHQTAAALTIARLAERGVSVARRRAVVLSVIIVFIGAAIFSIWHNARLPRTADFASGSNVESYVETVLGAGWMPRLLWPLKLVVRPFLARNGPTFLLHLEPALLVLAAHYAWVLRMDAPFAEGSIALAQKRSRMRTARQMGGSPWSALPRRAAPEPFRLGGHGRPEVAFLWKNLLSMRSSINWRAMLVPAIILINVAIPFAVLHGNHPLRGPMIVLGAAFVAFYTILIGPNYVRQDLRSDLPNADVLKSYPLAGWQIVLAEMLAPAAILSGVLWTCILVAALALEPGRFSWLAREAQTTTALCLAAVVPALCILQLLVPNASMLLFPGWLQSGGTRGGVEVIGQRLILVAGQLVLLLLVLLPAVTAAFLIIAASSWILGAVPAILLATGAVLTVLGGEIAVGLWWLGERFERFDLSTESRA